MRLATMGDGLEYYEYVLLYVDDYFCVSSNPKEVLLQIDKNFPMKLSPLTPPKIYLGGKVSHVILPNGVKVYLHSATQYVRETIRNVEEYFRK